MTKKKDTVNLAIYVMIFFIVWSCYELMIKPTLLDMSPLPSTFIQAIIKISLWTVPSYILIKKSTHLQIPYPQLFKNKIYWKPWLILLLGMVLFLLAGSYFQYGNLKIRETFQMISIINSVLFVGITEELVFRGWILNSLLSRFNIWIALILSSVLFVLIHFPTWIYTGKLMAILTSGSFIQVFVLSIIFGISFIKSRSIFVPMMLHMSWNLFTILFYK